MSDIWGKWLKISVFGESHGPAVGVTIDGLPAGFMLDMDELGFEMRRRAPGKSAVETARKEADIPEILSGMFQGRTTGTALTAIIRNANTRSSDYGEQIDLLRPGHADYPATVRYHGYQDFRGGGHASARLTAGYVFAGAICRQLLRAEGVEIFAHIERIQDICDQRFDPLLTDISGLMALRESAFPVIDAEASERMRARILEAKARGDSVGGVVECAIAGLPVGLGAPLFDSVESTLSSLLFSVPAVKGVEFGAGFGFAELNGSEANDGMRMENGEVRLTSNNSGGINGGMTNGCPVIFRAVLRATPSIGSAQRTVSWMKKEDADLTISGRHDPSVVPRAVPVIEAVAAIGIYELWKEYDACRAQN